MTEKDEHPDPLELIEYARGDEGNCKPETREHALVCDQCGGIVRALAALRKAHDLPSLSDEEVQLLEKSGEKH